MPSPGRRYTTVERLGEAHLAAVHEARLRLARERRAPPSTGPYTDYRAVLHVHAEDSAHTGGTRIEVLRAAIEDHISIVMFTDHRGPRPETWSGLRDGVLFFAGSEDDHLLRFPGPGGEMRFLSHLEEIPDATSEGFLGMEIYNRHTDESDERPFEAWLAAALRSPVAWARLARLEREYPDEIFGAGTDYWPAIFARWDRETARHPFTGIGANDSHQNQVFNGVTFDPYAVSFRSVITHILARELTPSSVREALGAGRVYVAHDWLCDPAGLSFRAVSGGESFESGGHVPMRGEVHLQARVPVPAVLRLIHGGRIIREVTADRIDLVPAEAGAYRLEAWLPIDGELRPWIYTNPVYLEAAGSAGTR